MFFKVVFRTHKRELVKKLGENADSWTLPQTTEFKFLGDEVPEAAFIPKCTPHIVIFPFLIIILISLHLPVT